LMLIFGCDLVVVRPASAATKTGCLVALPSPVIAATFLVVAVASLQTAAPIHPVSFAICSCYGNSAASVAKPPCISDGCGNTAALVLQEDEADGAESEEDDATWAKNVTAGKLSKGEKLLAVDHSQISYPSFRRSFYIEVGWYSSARSSGCRFRCCAVLYVMAMESNSEKL